jgi:hypothetical protein
MKTGSGKTYIQSLKIKENKTRIRGKPSLFTGL